MVTKAIKLNKYATSVENISFDIRPDFESLCCQTHFIVVLVSKLS